MSLWVNHSGYISPAAQLSNLGPTPSWNNQRGSWQSLYGNTFPRDSVQWTGQRLCFNRQVPFQPSESFCITPQALSTLPPMVRPLQSQWGF